MEFWSWVLEANMEEQTEQWGLVGVGGLGGPGVQLAPGDHGLGFWSPIVSYLAVEKPLSELQDHWNHHSAIAACVSEIPMGPQ